MLNIRFANPWFNPVNGIEYGVSDVASLADETALQLVHEGIGTLTTDDPTAVPTRYVTSDQLETLQPWAAEQLQSARWFLRASIAGPVAVSDLPVYLTTTAGEQMTASTPLAVAQLVLAATQSEDVTATLKTYDPAEPEVLTTIGTVVVLAGQTKGFAIVNRVIPYQHRVIGYLDGVPAGGLSVGATLLIAASDAAGVLV